MSENEDMVSALEARVKELEERVAEAGRRLLFAAEVEKQRVSPRNHDSISDVRADLDAMIRVSSELYERMASTARALLFDSETPNKPDLRF